jgi:hypothetical protein
MKIYGSVLRKTKNISDRVVEKIKTHLMFYQIFPKNLAVYEIMWKNTAEPGRPQMKIWCMRIACWITKATDENSEYAILIAFLLQQWWHECVSLLRYTYIACIVQLC